mmetsp:Transcript_22169/g.46777  ORF Transcript_22169/g.46777 Transcript_22169/m.46777 type:complete len:496 (+) Transcript_22169:132-1619(+)
MSRCNDDDSSLGEDDLLHSSKFNVHYDFSAWESFQESFSAESREAVRTFSSSVSRAFTDSLLSVEEDEAFKGSLLSVQEDEEDAYDYDEDEAKLHDDAEEDTKTKDVVNETKIHEDRARAHSSSWELTEEERYEIAAWRMRLTVGPVFSRNYTPERWERKEMNAIIDYLELKNPSECPEYLDEPGQEVTRNAIRSIFFPKPNELQPVLLKRGPVLFNGEERELMLFTNGFLFSRIELDTLVNILAKGQKKEENITFDQLCERFMSIDIDNSGELDRSEVRDFFFQGMGMTLSEASLDEIFDKFDSDSDGSISLNEFKAILIEVNRKPWAKTGRFTWKSLGNKLRKNVSETAVTRKCDVAFEMTDIEKVEQISICYYGNMKKVFACSKAASIAKVTFAVYIKGVHEPLMVTCSKPGHVDAWMEAFRTCITSLQSHAGLTRDSVKNIEHCHQGLIRGVVDPLKGTEDMPPEEKMKTVRYEEWNRSSIDWGDDDDLSL